MDHMWGESLGRLCIKREGTSNVETENTGEENSLFSNYAKRKQEKSRITMQNFRMGMKIYLI